jgi:hypothetical protein
LVRWEGRLRWGLQLQYVFVRSFVEVLSCGMCT